MTKGIRIAKGLTLPLDAVTQTFAILAVTGAGKSNTAAVMAEGFYDAGVPFVVIDPEGSWWGLRSAADGKGPGLSIPIFGGEKGDVPLEEAAGQMVAELIAKERLSCLLDVSEFSVAAQRRFLTDFAVTILKRNKDPLHLFLEEADEYIPQKPYKGAEKLLGAWQKVVRRGRKKGIGNTMITQRSAVINKDALTQTRNLIVHQITAELDRKAIEGWVKYYAQKEEMLASLSDLKPGEAWIWSPWMGTTKNVQVYRRRTFDSAATPTITKRRRRPPRLADINLGAIKDQMADTIERAKETDPKELRRRIGQLERELAQAPKELPAPEPEVVEVPVFTDEDKARISDLLIEVESVDRGLHGSITHLKDVAERIHGLKKSLSARKPQSPPKARPQEAAGATIAPPRGSRPAECGDYRPRAGARRMLEVLARRYPLTTSKSQLRLMARLRRSGTSETYYRELMSNELIYEGLEGWIKITKGGFEILGLDGPSAPMTSEENIESFRGLFRAGARRMLDILLDIHPQEISRDELFERAELTNSGTSSAYLRDLVKNDVAEVNGSLVRAGEALFL